ncbi:MAG: helix-turn-helix domain-containing protein [Polyangiaceae bacterium]
MNTSLDDTLNAIGRRIREIRRQKGETQESLSAKIAMLAPNFAKIEQGRTNPTIETLLRIADGLEVELAELFRRPQTARAKPGRPPKSEL